MARSDADQKVGLLEGLDRARQEGEDKELAFLERMDAEMEQHKYLEAGQDHRWWKRNWAVYRLKHVQNRDDRFPRPLENHVFSLIETVRPTFSDNVPEVNIVAMVPGLEQQEAKLNALWRWVAQTGMFESFWGDLYDYWPQTGLTAGKVVWDASAPRGGRVRFSHIDPRAVASDPLATLNHRNCQVLRLKHRVDVGELKSLFPEISDKIHAVSSMNGTRSQGLSDLANSRDTGIDASLFGSAVEDRTAEVVEMWIKPDVDVLPFSETSLNDPEPEAGAEVELGGGAENPWIVYTYIPGAGIIDREITLNGLQVGTGQAWRNPDSIYGISDVEMVVGIQIALDQLAIRGHTHRLAMFSPPLILPGDSGVTRKHVSGRAAPIWEPTTSQSAEGIGWLNVPGPNGDALNYIINQPNLMRKLLGHDELTADVLNRQQTATAVAEVREALESRLRQKIRNLNNLVVDLARTGLSLAIQNMPVGAAVRGEDGSFEEVDTQELADIDLGNFAVKLSTERTGPLTKMGKMASIRQVIELGVFDPANPMPLELKETIIDNLDVPRGEQLKATLRQQEEARIAQEQALLEQQQQQEALLAQQAEAEAGLIAEQEAQGAPVEEGLTEEELNAVLN